MDTLYRNLTYAALTFNLTSSSLPRFIDTNASLGIYLQVGIPELDYFIGIVMTFISTVAIFGRYDVKVDIACTLQQIILCYAALSHKVSFVTLARNKKSSFQHA